MALDALGAAGANDEEKTAEARTAARMGVSLMSDEARGAAYRLAVETQARDTDLVLDVGGGVGLLGVVAARAGAKRVVIFAPTTANLASSVALANNIPPDRLHVLDASVADARPDGPDAWRVRAEAPVLGAVLDVAQPRANLVLAESLETNLLDPGPLANLRRAAATLLSPGYACVPAAAVVRAQVVTSAHLRDSITLRPLGDASDPADPVWFRETTRTSPPTSRGAGGEDDLVAVSEPFEAFRVDFANLPPETVETRAIVPIVLGDDQRSAAAEALAVAYWWTCDATKSSSSAKSTASSPPARGSPTRRLAILPTPVRIPEDATTLVVSIVRDEDRVRFRVAARAEGSAHEDSEHEDPEDEDPEHEDPEDPSAAAAAFPSHDPVPNTSSPSSIPWDRARVARWNSSTFRDAWRVAARCALYDFRSVLFTDACVDASDGPALAILAADAGAKGVLSLETTREGAVFARRLARACGVADVVHACAVRFDKDENPREDEPSDEHPRGFDPSPPSFDPFAVAAVVSTEATRACRAARTAATRARGADDAVVAALEAYESAVMEALRERRVPTPCAPENAYGLDDPWNERRGDEDARWGERFLFGFETRGLDETDPSVSVDAFFEGVDYESARDDPRVRVLLAEYERRAAVAARRRRRADALRADAERAETIAAAALGATRATLAGARVASFGTVGKIAAQAWTFFADPWFDAEAKTTPGSAWTEAGLREVLRRRRWARRAGVLHAAAKSSPCAAAIRVATVACPKLAEDATRRRRPGVVLGVDLAALDRIEDDIVDDDDASVGAPGSASVDAFVGAPGSGSFSAPVSVLLSDVSHAVLAAPLAALLVPLQGTSSETRATISNVVRARFHGGASGATCDALAAWVDYDLGGGAWITTGPDPAGAATNYGVAGSPNPDDGGIGAEEDTSTAAAGTTKRRRRANRSGREQDANRRAAANASKETRRTSTTSFSSPSSRRREFAIAAPGPFKQGILVLDAPVTAPPGGWATIEVEARFHPEEGFTAKILSIGVERGRARTGK